MAFASSTGSGKTLAYLLPTMQRLREQEARLHAPQPRVQLVVGTANRLLALLGRARSDAGSARGDRLCKYRLGDVVKGAIPKHSGAKIYGRTARDYPESLAARYLREAGGRHGAHSASNALSLRRSTGADHRANFTFASQVAARRTSSQSSSRYAYHQSAE